MKNNKKKINRTSLLTILLAVLAVCLLLIGGIGGARAALSPRSDTFTGTLETPTVNVQIVENNKNIANGGKLLENVLGTDKALVIGKPYEEELRVQNTGDTAAFVRITLYKYWTDGSDKQISLDPAYINLFLGEVGEDWYVDEDASTDERTVLYYLNALKPGEKTTPALTEISASSQISTLIAQETKNTVTDGDTTYTTIESTYSYDGLKLNLEASADAIQTHNAQDAIKASWGVDVTADETTLSFD